MLKRKVTDAIRFIFETDDALDMTADEYIEFLASGCNENMLKLKAGAKPTVFTLQQMTHRQKLTHGTLDRGFGQSCFTVRCGLARIENYEVEFPGGEIRHFSDLERKKEGDLGELVTEKQLADLQLGMNEIATLALGILAISEANLPLLKHCAFPAGALA